MRIIENKKTSQANKDNFRRINAARGFTLIEYSISISILLVVGVMVMSVFVQFNREQALETETDRIAGILTEARAKTLDSRNASQFGIHIAASSVTEFQGTTYSPSDPNNIVSALSPLVTIASTSLTAGVSDIIFDRLTGNAEATGTITVALAAQLSSVHVVQILGTGVAQRIK